MTIVERFQHLNLPASQCVVIGSGILDALNLRESDDIDLVVTEELFEQLRESRGWREEIRNNEAMLLKDDVEVWLSWGSKGVPNFHALYDECMVVEGVHFANPRFVIAQKRESAREKDMRDIKLLEGYLS